MKFLGIISVDFNIVDQLLIRYSAFVRYWRKMQAQWVRTSIIHRFRKCLWLSYERSNVKQYVSICYTCETSCAN
jgi:hypothetical protein